MAGSLHRVTQLWSVKSEYPSAKPAFRSYFLPKRYFGFYKKISKIDGLGLGLPSAPSHRCPQLAVLTQQSSHR